MDTRFGRIACRLCACATMMLCVALTVEAAPAGSITLVSQERVLDVHALVPVPSGTPDSKHEATLDVGPFSTGLSAQSTGFGCLTLPTSEITPNACVLLQAFANTSQHSLIDASGGALEIRARGTAGTFGPGASAKSSLTSTFVVEGTVGFILQADGMRGSVVLTGDAGPVFEHHGLSAAVSNAGVLTAGTYTLTVDVTRLESTPSSILPDTFNVRFTAGAAGEDLPRCVVQMTSPGYTFGEVVTAAQLRIENSRPVPLFVELKVWLKMPDGQRIPARNDGPVSIPASTVHNFGPLDVMGVDADIAKGVWELACRLLEPVTGEALAESSDLFEIR